MRVGSVRPARPSLNRPPVLSSLSLYSRVRWSNMPVFEWAGSVGREACRGCGAVSLRQPWNSDSDIDIDQLETSDFQRSLGFCSNALIQLWQVGLYCESSVPLFPRFSIKINKP